MCGIFGYIGSRRADRIIVKGLKRLEYRGYDSWGLAVKQGSDVKLLKKVGRIGDAKDIDLSDGRLGIGHTRWATHGNVTQGNAHPHRSGKVFIVHNGIIENFDHLKKLLESEGYIFISETDSEVLAHLVHKYYAGNLEDAVRQALCQVEGTYGIAVIHSDEDKIVAARNGSPLLLGIGNEEFFIASDASPIVHHTKKVIYLDDGDIAVIGDGSYKVTNLENQCLMKEIDEITWSIEEMEKKGYKHFMLKEIMEQPDSFLNTLRGHINRQGPKFGGLEYLSLEFLKKVKRIIIIASGTSWHAGLVGEYLIEEITRVPVEVEYSSEFRYRDPIVDEHDLVIVISQSGETADTLAALREAKKKGAKTMGIVNVVGSTIAREVEGGIYLHAGPEIGVASTKAFTSQVGALYMFTVYLAFKQGKITLKRANELQDNIAKIPDQMKELLKRSSEMREIAEKYYQSHNFLYLGRGINYPVALEGALKLKEISYIHAEGYPAAEMKHGPIALIDEKMPVVFVAPSDGAYQKVMNNMQEVKARGGKIIVIASKKDPALSKVADHQIHIQEVSQDVSPLLTAIPLQLLAYHMADLRGCDIDKPRNLAKSVTVE